MTSGLFAGVPLHLRGRLRGNDLLVYVALAWRTDEHQQCWPSQATLAEDVGLSVSSVKRALASLRDMGVVSWVQRSSGSGGQTSNGYRLHPYLPDPDAVVVPAPLGHDGLPLAHTELGGSSHRATKEIPVEEELHGTYGPAPRCGDAEPGSALEPVADRPTAQTLVGEWLDRCRSRPPGRVVGQVARELRLMLDEGIDPDAVRRGLAAWHARGLSPSALPSLVNEQVNPPSRAAWPRRRETADDRLAQTLALAEQLRSERLADARALPAPTGAGHHLPRPPAPPTGPGGRP